MSNPGIQQVALTTLRRAVNTALELDPATQQRLARLDGHSFKIDCQQPALMILLSVSGTTLQLSFDDRDDTSTAISGSFAEFSKIALADDPAGALINGDVRVAGDTAPLLELRAILADLDIDWEKPLSRLFGDVTAHQIGRGLRNAQRFVGNALQQFRRQVSEFIVEESELVPHPIEVEDFFRDIESLSAQTERLEARLRQLRERLSEGAS